MNLKNKMLIKNVSMNVLMQLISQAKKTIVDKVI